MLDQALFWYDQGYTPVPLAYRTKVPKTPWRQWAEVQPPRPLVVSWFSGLVNMALIVARDLVVVDFDNLAAHRVWRDTALPHYFNTRTHRSRRGWHYFYQVLHRPPATYPILGGEVLIDHLVTLPPSTHQSGVKYQIANAAPILIIERIEDLNLLASDEVSPVNDIVIPEPPAPKAVSTGGVVAKIKSGVPILNYLLRFRQSQPKKSGQSYLILCPFHEDHSPSMQVWPDTGRCKCYSPHCPAYSRRAIDIIDIATIAWGISAPQAISRLAKEV